MRVARFVKTAAVISCIVGMVAMPASADAPALAFNQAVRTGAKAVVGGTAVFPTITEAQSVGGNNTNFAQADVANAAGINLTDAKIQPLADGSGLRFIWVTSGLPEQTPPEGVRYTWSFKIGETQYQLQAKRTNMASITTAEDPVNHAKQLASQQPFFQLRGACVTSYEGAPTSGCYHLAFLKGAFDVANKTVSMELPYNTRDQIGRLVAPDFKPGAVLEANDTAGMSITAAFQAVIGNTSTSDYTNGWTSYYTGKRVDLAVGPANAAGEELDYSTPATVTGNDFRGEVTGLSNANNTVFARACSGVSECTYAKVTPAVG
jgi:hypothetical protein